MKEIKKLEKRVIKTVGDDLKPTYEIARLLRLKRRVQLEQLRVALNSLYSQDVIDTIMLDGEKNVYVKSL